jgi:DNA-directed RNA polymerase
MKANQFKNYLSDKPTPKKQKDLTPELISIAETRMKEIEEKVSTLTSRILDNKYQYIARRMQKEKRELMDAWEFNRQLVLSLKGESGVL